jgi:hypothetical protein
MANTNLNDIRNSWLPASILGLAVIIATIIGSYAFYHVRALDDTLSVTGSAKVSVKADNASWDITVSRVSPTDSVSSAYAQVAADTAKVKDFLSKNAVKAEEIEVSPIFVEDYYGNSNSDSVRRSTVRQVVTVKSTDVDRIKTISQNTSVLADEDVQFSPAAPEYYISTLPELRVSLLGKAIADGQARAVEIAKPMGQSVGKLKSAASGVVQVLQSNSIDVSDYGQYDTSTIDKDVMVTVRATFVLQ